MVRKNYGLGPMLIIVLAGMGLSLVMGLPFLIGTTKILTDTKIIITVIIVVGVVMLAKVKRQPQYPPI